MKERKQSKHDDCVICQAGTLHDVHKLADGDYDQQELRVVADLMDRFSLARVEVLPFDQVNQVDGHLFNPEHNILVINGVPVIGFAPDLVTAQVIEKALKKGKL